MISGNDDASGSNGANVLYGVQTIFSTIPNQKGINFERDVEENYFTKFKSEIKSEDNHLYTPLKYYMLGDYDVCYISLINNFKFSHRLFEPKSKDEKTVYNAHSFQSFSGIARQDPKVLELMFQEKVTSYFIGVINLKLNNGLLIGNGLKFLDAVTEKLHEILNGTKFLLTQTFSWFELSLAVFINDPKELAEILAKVRMAEFGDLHPGHLEQLSDSLYHSIFSAEEKSFIKNTSLFADTNTFFGFNDKLIIGKLDSDPYVQQFISDVNTKKITLESEIEWQVKPGHILHLEELLKANKHLKPLFDFDQRKVALGKCDYMLKEIDSDILSNFHLVRHLNYSRKTNCNLFDHIRKVRTYIFLDGRKFGKEAKSREFFCWDKSLDKLAVKSGDFNKIDLALKRLKISRQVRIKILKIFSNYNNGIQDPILFPYFLDFTIFIRNLIKHIYNMEEKAGVASFSLKEFETDLNEHIKVFQEGYDVRFLNAYQFENISDFDLDFNSSIQQLLTSYGTLVHEYGNLFYKQGKIPYGPLIQLNNIDTTSNYRCINYSIHHLTSPEFVFSTLLKEILNHFRIDNGDLELEFQKFEKNLKKILRSINQSYLDDMVKHNLVDFEYLIIDYIRFVITFNCDFNLFQHWFWSYNFQNPSLFDTSGMFNEDHFRKELLRISLIKEMCSVKEELACPTRELETYWVRHLNKIVEITEYLAREIRKYNFINNINSVVVNYLENYRERGDKDSTTPVFTYMTKVERLPNIGQTEIRELQLAKLKWMFSDGDGGADIFEIEKLLFNTLLGQYGYNLGRVTLLKRSWDDGILLSNYNGQNKEILYAIDQTGGVFFYGIAQMNKYFNDNTICLLKLINFSLIRKKDFIIKQSKYA